MKKLVSVKVASAVIAGLGLTAGVVGVVGASSGTIGNTGSDSANHVTASDTTKHNSANVTGLENTTNNPQDAVSGDATSTDGRDNGAAATGVAGNDSTISTGAVVDYSSSTAADAAAAGAPTASTGAINGTTGDDSKNTVDVKSNTTVNSLNATGITNTTNNSQAARSGDATVSGNRDAGSAATGAATNKSNISSSFNVKY